MIDRETILKKIHNKLSEEENIVFDNWLKASPDHLAFYNSAMEYYSNGSGYHNIPVDVVKGWEKVNSKINNSKC